MKPIIIYKRKRCSVSRKAEKFFKKYNIAYRTIFIDEEKMSKETLLFIIQSVEDGLNGVLKIRNKLMQNKEVEKWGFQNLLNYLVEDVEHQHAIKTPIIIQGEKVVIGSKEEELRTFLPRELKKQLFIHYLNEANKENLVG